MPALGSLDQWTLTTIVRAVYVRAAPQKPVHLFDFAVLCCPDQLPMHRLFLLQHWEAGTAA
jgi:hypothetical protein